MVFFFFNDTATTEIYTLSLHDALPIFSRAVLGGSEPTSTQKGPRQSRLAYAVRTGVVAAISAVRRQISEDRKSTRLNSSHANISYAVFCLKKKKKTTRIHITYTVKTSH